MILPACDNYGPFRTFSSARPGWYMLLMFMKLLILNVHDFILTEMCTC